MGTSMTAMLVGTPEDVGGHPGVTATIPRDEIEEALASDQPLDLILDVTRPKDGGVETTDVTVTWQRSDLESLLAGINADAITLSFDRVGLERAIDEPDFEGQGIREVMLLTVAAASASAAMAVSTAQGQVTDAGGGGGSVPVVVAPGHGEAGTASALAPSGLDVPIATAIAAHDTATGAFATSGHDEATLAARGVDVPIATAIAAAGAGEATTARDLAAPPAIHDETSLAARGVGQADARDGRGDPRRTRHRDRRAWQGTTRRRSQHGGSMQALPRRPMTRRPSLREASASPCPGWTRRRSRPAGSSRSRFPRATTRPRLRLVASRCRW